MKYIKNRDQFNTVGIITEAGGNPANQLYDGTWEDTFIGNFFSFIGRKITNKAKKGKLNRLLNQLQRELEKSQFKTIEQEPIAQQYDVYQSIVILKSYVKNSPNFEKDEFLRELDVSYRTPQRTISEWRISN